MPIARSIDETWDYQLERERDKPGATSFKLGAIKSGFEARVGDLIAAAKVYEAYDMVLRVGGLRGWSDHNDVTGTPIPFAGKGGAEDDDLARLELKDRLELGRAAYTRNKITARERD